MRHKEAYAILLGLIVSVSIFALFIHAKDTKSMNSQIKTKEIYLAGGCFWGTEHFFKQVRGVISTEVGYANGNKENPTYEEV